jgi:hypothetical protein
MILMEVTGTTTASTGFGFIRFGCFFLLFCSRTANTNIGHGSPARPTRTGANPETPLLDFNFDPRSPTMFYNGAGTTPMSYLPTQIPSSRYATPTDVI